MKDHLCGRRDAQYTTSIMRNGLRFVDRLIVPVTFAIALLGAVAVTIAWVTHPPATVGLYVTLGPPDMVPRREYGVKFTPHDPATGRVLELIPSQRHCVRVTITDSILSSVDQRLACRSSASDGGYKLVYTFPAYRTYVLFVEMHPIGGVAETYRLTLPLDPCSLRHRQRPCPMPPAPLRGQEAQHMRRVAGLTAILGWPPHAVTTGPSVPISVVFLERGRPVFDLAPAGYPDEDAIAISMDTNNVVRLHPDAGQVVRGRLAGSSVAYTGAFDRNSIYRVFVAVRYQGRRVHTSFVIDVNATPTPTAAPG